MTSYIGRGARDPGPWNQPGVIVVQPTWVAFVPTEPRTYLASVLGKAALGVVTGVIVMEIGGREVSPADLAAALQSLAEAELLPAVRRLVASTDGVLYTATEAQYREQTLPLGVRSSFEAPGDRLIVLEGKSARANPRYQAIVAAWPRIVEKPAKPIGAWTAVAIGTLVGLAGLASSLFTLIVLAVAVDAPTSAGWTTSAVFCCLDGALVAPAAGLIVFGVQRLRRHRSASA